MEKLRNIYYFLKPVIPRSVQLGMRRVRANRIVKNNKDIWPIDKSIGNAPDGWKGWPNGKKFCVVLSHDVDTQPGHDKVLQLLDLEDGLGFKSSYNFVPERYNLSIDLIRKVQQKEFGIAVHGLKHDGKLFSNIEIFTRRSKKINQYIKEWDTRGFTAPAMIRNLDWMYMLDIEYATTTFDTDPIEPQPDGAYTIFPYRVKAPDGNSSYIELPYTLPQDFTMFIILRKKTINVWKQKLDWIASKGGMVLLNSHPDYMNFGDRSIGAEEYSVDLYAQLLQYIKERYGDDYWLALPEEVSTYIRDNYK